MKKIWSECDMPGDCINNKNEFPADVFKFEFAFLPLMKFQREQFDEEVKKLKARFERNAPNTFYEDTERLPIDGLPSFL